jgi:hypothetical protein
MSNTTNLTKKQRQNAKKTEKLKALKQEESALQDQRLQEYKKTQEQQWLQEQIKRDIEQKRKQELVKGSVSAPPPSQPPREKKITADTWFDSKGRPIWDD